MRWIIGDIHGMLAPLRTVVDAIDRIDSSARIFFVGDYVNRGPDSRGVIDFLLTLKNARFCRGNHDDVFDLVLNGIGYAENDASGDRASALTWFMQHGLIQTFMSYGADFATLEKIGRGSASASQLKSLCDMVPPEHRRFIRTLRAVVEEDDLFIVHAMYPLEMPSEEPRISFRLTADAELRSQLLWGRFNYGALVAEKLWKRTGYFGHTPSQNYVEFGATNQPLIGDRMVLVDTGAALATDGRLTAYCADTKQYIQADPGGELTKTV
ncbi:metallophosphoesterase family protein [soil metagenome]